MLITQGGRLVGAISGGCLEADVFERTQQVMVSGKAVADNPMQPKIGFPWLTPSFFAVRNAYRNTSLL